MTNVLNVALQKATAPTVMRSRVGAWLWRNALSAPAIPDRARSALAYRLHSGMVESGRAAEAAEAFAAAVVRLRDHRIMVDLLTRQALDDLTAGRTPIALQEAIAAGLALADDLREKHDPQGSARFLYRTLRLIFHRALHFDRLSSPLAEDPAQFLAPLRSSVAGRALAAPRGRATPAAAPPDGRPLRLVIATNGNDHFLREIRQRYEDSPAVEVRFLHLARDPVSEPLTRGAGQIVEHLLTGGEESGGTEYGNRVEEWLRPHLDWADTIFVDWCVAAAAIVTLVDPGTTRVVLRLHSFEALSFWPHLVDFSRVDDLVVVSEHLRDLVEAVLPQLAADEAPRMHVIPNAMDLRAFPRPKSAQARFTLGLIGLGAVAKDPRWAIEVLRLLRARDPRYRLLLIGDGLDRTKGPSVAQYDDLLMRDLGELEPSGSVIRLGHVRDVPSGLSDVGVILSSSVRESFHCGLVEGAASGAVPVVRDWPFFAGMAHGARSLFPDDWVVDTPAEAAARILAVTATDESWREAGRAASSHSLTTWDWTVIAQRFDDLLGTAVPASAG